MRSFVGKERLKRWVAWAVRDRVRCIFVLSTGRVGTVTLTHLLNLSDDIEAEHEPGPQLLEETRAAYEGRPLAPAAGQSLFTRYTTARARPLLQAVRRRTTYAECSNRLTFIADLLADGLPNSRFLYLYRDPASVVRSGMRRGWYRNHPWDPYRIRPNPADPWSEAWEGWGPFEKCCWFWNATNEFCLRIVDRLREERRLALSTRTLFARDGSGAHLLFDWLGVRSPNEADVLQVVGTRYNAGTKGEFPAWPDWSEARRTFLARIAGHTAERLGFPTYAPLS